MFQISDSSISRKFQSNCDIGGTQAGRLVLRGSEAALTPSIDNGFVVPFRNRDEGGEGRVYSIFRGACQYQRQWFRVKLTITEPQMEPQGGRVSVTVARSAGDFWSQRRFEVIRM